MDDTLTMNRLIHNAVRRDLARLEPGLRNLTEGDRGRADQLQRTWDNLSAQLTHHHEGEDDHVWPWLRSVGIDPGLLDAMESEHEDLAAALGNADRAIAAACTSASPEQAAQAADLVAEAATVVERHLAHEEQELEPLMAPHLGTAEWKAVEKKLRSVPPRTAGWFFAWIQDGASSEELAYLHSLMPGPVLAILSKGFGRGYAKKVASAWN